LPLPGLKSSPCAGKQYGNNDLFVVSLDE
jgi:hypothetical protein